MRRTVYNEVVARPGINPAALTDGTVNGPTVDRHYESQGFRSVGVVVSAGALTDGSHAITLEESPDGSAWSAVPAESIQGTLPTTTAATDSDSTFEFGYTGHERYVRVVCTTSGSTAGGVLGAVVLLGGARRRPAIH